MCKLIRALAMGVMTIALLAAVLFLSGEVRQMIRNIRYGVDNPAAEIMAEMAEGRTHVAAVQNTEGRIREYVLGNMDVVLQAVEDFGKLDAEVDYAKLGCAYRYPSEMISGVGSPALIQLLTKDGVEAITREADGALSFCMDSAGNVTASVEFGFYYAPDDAPQFIYVQDEYAHLPFVETKGGWWVDTSGAPDRTGGPVDWCREMFTSRIAENLFYYELYID